jgi:hypothetical protein
MFWTKVVDKIKKVDFFQLFSKIGTSDVIMWKNIVEPDRPQVTVWRMRIACSITDPTYTYTHTHTHTENM